MSFFALLWNAIISYLAVPGNGNIDSITPDPDGELRMKVTKGDITVQTRQRHDLVNITADVDSIIVDSGMATGICLASVPHTTCALTVNEDERGLVQDMVRMAGELLAPLRDRNPFQHDRIDNNAQAHLTSALIGCSVALPVREGRLHLGTWQNLFLLDGDGPRTRRVDITLMGE